MDAYTQNDRRRARLALIVLLLALCEGASERQADPAPEAASVIASIVSK